MTGMKKAGLPRKSFWLAGIVAAMAVSVLGLISPGAVETRHPLRIGAGPPGHASSSAAPKVDVDVSACRAVFNILKAMSQGAPREKISSRLDAVLATHPFRIMFKHYNRSWRPNHLPETVFKRMIMSLRFEGEYSPGENERADAMLVRWREFYDDLPLYEKTLLQLEEADLRRLIGEGATYAQSWLPPGWSIPDFEFSVIPNGGSPAFVIDGAQGNDFFQLPRDASGSIEWDRLLGTIAHESHHLGNRPPDPGPMAPADSVAFKVMSLCVGEGTATEFISGAPGGLVPPVPGLRYQIFKGDAKLSAAWDALVPEEPAMFEHLIALLDKASSGALSDDDLQAEISAYWLNGFIGRAYFLGSELFGAIYHAFGKEGVFSAMRDPRKLFELYSQALDAKPEMLGRCFRIPESAVKRALAIGRAKK